MILQTGAKYQNGDKLKITLPEGQKYLAVSLSSRMGEAILYLPGGVFEYTFADLDKTYPDTMNPTKSARSYTDNTVSARIPTEKEITESRNLAYNPYDLTEGSAYPHVTADSYYGEQAEFAPRNVIDGFTANDSHGTYPYQSWGTEKSDRHWITVDFGREVTVNELQFFVRADFSGGHDTHFTSAVAEFSDGSEMPVPLYRTANAVCVDLGGRTTTFVKLKNFVRAADTWAAVTEIRILGSEGKASDGTAAASTYGGKVPRRTAARKEAHNPFPAARRINGRFRRFPWLPCGMSGSLRHPNGSAEKISGSSPSAGPPSFFSPLRGRRDTDFPEFSVKKGLANRFKLFNLINEGETGKQLWQRKSAFKPTVKESGNVRMRLPRGGKRSLRRCRRRKTAPAPFPTGKPRR